MAAVGVFAYRLRDQPWPPHRIIGAAIVLLALALITVARVQLGASFSVSAQARHLVTTGLYSRIRNPIYVFAELVFAGAAVFMWSWWPVVIMVALIPMQMKRARREAAVLQDAFGEEYVAYRQRTWF
jgi:protein-S-isoprenylcysteine O-methyltransferase Ste14